MKKAKTQFLSAGGVLLLAGMSATGLSAATRAVIPVAGSTAGAHGSNFKTELQLNNRSAQPMSGTLVFHAAGRSAAASDPSLDYTLAPHETKSFEDVVAEFGVTGLGSVDIVSEGKGVPTVVARAFDDAGAAGTKGVTIPSIAPDNALQTGESSALIVPMDLQRYRFNVGIRTLSAGAKLRVTVYGANGFGRAVVDVPLAADFFVQQPADALIGGTLLSDEALVFEVVEGSAIIYGTTTDNTTNDPSIQFATRPQS
jgi:hypothetical protein